MKLYTSALSPFARKCRIVAAEVGLAGELELATQAVSPVNPDAAYQAQNPLAKIPALETEGGHLLFDSHVICDYLIARAGARGEAVLPTGPARFDVLTRQALASGMTDAAILVRYEVALRPEALRWREWQDGQLGKFEAGLRAFEQAADAWLAPAPTPDLGQIALACGLTYVDVRFPELGWRSRAPRVAAWLAEIERRPSFAETAPPAQS